MPEPWLCFFLCWFLAAPGPGVPVKVQTSPNSLLLKV